MNAIDNNPVNNMVIPKPLNFGGTLEYRKRWRMADIDAIAKNHPNPDPNPNTVDSINVYSRSTRNNEPPRIAQFTAISGKKIPRL